MKTADKEAAEMQARDRVSVCICTFKRPQLLLTLLEALEQQADNDAFAFDVVIVDNDATRSSESVVSAFAQRSRRAVHYDCEPERNISLTRNRAVRNATGNLVAFIDDDEQPVREWLVRLYHAMRQASADGALGPVLPEFPAEAPGWLKRGRVFERRRHATGDRISAKDARTGNLLVRRSIFTEHGCWFDPAFGRTGGEDTDFFARQFRAGGVFVWCDEAIASEVVPPERWTVSFHVKRLLRAGTIDGEAIRAGSLRGRGLVLKNILILIACAVLTGPAFALPKHIRMRVAQKLAYCGGLVSAYFGLSLLRYRD